jgi:hypothetical protein
MENANLTQMARRVMTDAQNDCYFFAVLLEWARLMAMGEGGDVGGGLND